ncbi:MAG TPA: sigma-70 family RNA polymerase sigma factor [Blastocatellia bacterium]|nr:sigma-70 family RNA polymerase sigma factor [Blastocatellia bacterium]
MTLDEFQHTFAEEIKHLQSRVEHRYSVSDSEMSATVYASAKKYLPEALDEASGNPGPTAESRRITIDFLVSLNANDLCLAAACAKGDEGAWEDFFREYRSYLLSVARTMVSDAGAAEQLADSTFAELYGLRESGGERVSKFSFYSGRGSLRGWLRAVVFQLSADHHRQSSRLVQPEEPEDMDRIAHAFEKPKPVPVTDLEYVADRYRAAVEASLRRAISDLEPRERLLLAYYYCDQMTLREIGGLFDVHEATVSRWLTRIQKRTRKLLEKALARDYEFKRREIAESIELAAEKLDITIGDYLLESVSADREREQPAGTPAGRTLADERMKNAQERRLKAF